MKEPEDHSKLLQKVNQITQELEDYQAQRKK
jgi:hypothetical protein